MILIHLIPRLVKNLSTVFCGLCMTVTLCGCGDAPAEFREGTGESPLDGSVISDGGHTIQLRLALDLDSLSSATIDGSGGPTIEFDEPIGGMAVLSEIETAGGESKLSVDRDTEEITIQAVASAGIGPMELSGALPDEMIATRSFLMPEARTPAHAGDCDEVVESISAFCDRFGTNRDASLEEVTTFALDIAEAELSNSVPAPFIEQTIREYYEVLDIFCKGFTEVVDGTPSSAPVDICASVREEDGEEEEEAVPSRFSLNFAAIFEGDQVGCGDRLDGFGPGGAAEIEISDLRFYVSNLQFFKEGGEEIPVELDDNEFQYLSDDGSVVLIDLTDTAEGACAGEGLGFPEGTARTHDAITGLTLTDQVWSVSFDVGMQQPLMKQVLANNTAEDAPSPLREMHWSWAFAYRHFVMNFTMTADGIAGEGYVHVGSTDCGGDGTRALTDREECGKLNNPTVSFARFDLAADTIAIDVRALLAGLDFQVEVTEPSQAMVPGVACHSSADQPDCSMIFENFGVDMGTGSGDAARDAVFSVR